jgi:purine-binding chemotaxis protein CheW
VGVNVALEEKSEDIIQLIGFYVGRKLYGADIMAVREILRDPEIEPVAQGEVFLQGMIDLRGQQIPVIDLRFCLGLDDDRPASNRHWVLVVQTGASVAGYLVDSVAKILRVPTGHLLPPPEIIVAGLRSPYMRGVCETEKGLLVVLDMERVLLAEERRKIHELTLA